MIITLRPRTTKRGFEYIVQKIKELNLPFVSQREPGEQQLLQLAKILFDLDGFLKKCSL